MDDRRIHASLLAPLIVVVWCTTAAQAQSSDSPLTLSVYDRERPAFDARGIRRGSFLVFPTLDASATYDSNLFAQQASTSETTDDLITRIRPGLRLQSDWNNHAVAIFADSDIALYTDNPREDYRDYSLGFDGQLDITRGNTLSAAIRFEDQHEDRGSPDNIGAPAFQTFFQTLSVDAGYTRDVGRVSLAVSGGYTDQNFEDADLIGGGVFNNDDRDRERYQAAVRLGYDVNDTYEAFLRVAGNAVEYADSTEDGGPNRDSDGYEIVAGTSFSIGGTATGDVFIGYVDQMYTSNRLSDVSDVTFGLAVLWSPQRLTSIELGVARTVEETTVADFADDGTVAFAAGILATRLSLRIEQEFRRNILGYISGQYSDFAFENVVRQDDIYRLGAGIRWLLSRKLSLVARYDFERRDTNVVNQDFDRHTGLLSLMAQF